MAEYIDRETLINDICEGMEPFTVGYVIRTIKRQPAADVAPVVHGRWVTYYRSGTTVAEGYVSTCCDMWNNRKSDYCPNCGAKMDESMPKDGAD